MSTVSGAAAATPSVFGRTNSHDARRQWGGELLALAYIALIAELAGLSGAPYLMFPELGALSQDIFTRPRGAWANAPVLLVLTPVLTGVAGSFCTRALPYGYVSVLLTVAVAAAIIFALGSPIAPAVSAGLLPLVLGIRSLAYAPGILLSTILLAVIARLWQGFTGMRATAPGEVAAPTVTAPPNSGWLAVLMLFVAAGVCCVKLTGLRFILFPPLVTIGFEMFGHPQRCPWVRRPLLLPVVCFLTAAGGLMFYRWFGVGPLGAVCSVAWGIAVMRTFDLHAPPALAVGLLPLVMDRPTVAYPISVAAGTVLITTWFLVYRSAAQWWVRPIASPAPLGG